MTRRWIERWLRLRRERPSGLRDAPGGLIIIVRMYVSARWAQGRSPCNQVSFCPCSLRNRQGAHFQVHCHRDQQVVRLSKLATANQIYLFQPFPNRSDEERFRKLSLGCMSFRRTTFLHARRAAGRLAIHCTWLLITCATWQLLLPFALEVATRSSVF